MYNAASHPDVKSQKRTESEIREEFQTTFEQHHKAVNATNDRIDLTEFTDYFAHVSSTIDSDAQFELVMSNIWNIGGQS